VELENPFQNDSSEFHFSPFVPILLLSSTVPFAVFTFLAEP